MTAATKSNTKWILTTIGSMTATFIVVITATVKVTMEFDRNNLDHTVIKQELRNEQIRSEEAQSNLSDSYYKTLKTMDEMRMSLDSVRTNQTKVMTNQERIKQDIQKISDKIGTP